MIHQQKKQQKIALIDQWSTLRTFHDNWCCDILHVNGANNFTNATCENVYIFRFLYSNIVLW